MANVGGAVSGAASGASTGAYFGPWGAAIGGVIGGIAGLFSGGSDPEVVQELYKQPGLEGAQQRLGQAILAQQQPGKAVSALDASDAFRQQQLALTGQLAQTAQGQGPLVSEQQTKMAQENALAQALALQATQRGGNVGLTQRQTLGSLAQQNQAINQQGQLARLQEIFAAREALGNLASQGRLGDVQLGGAYAQEQQGRLQGQIGLEQVLAQRELAQAAANQNLEGALRGVDEEEQKRARQDFAAGLSGASSLGAALTTLGGSGGGTGSSDLVKAAGSTVEIGKGIGKAFGIG